jgi:hypothetical protein
MWGGAFATLGVVVGKSTRENVKNPSLAVLCSPTRAMLSFPGEHVCFTGAYEVLHSGHRARIKCGCSLTRNLLAVARSGF